MVFDSESLNNKQYSYKLQMKKIKASSLISKIALDKNKQKLGKIVRIEKIPGKTVKAPKPCVIIRVQKIFQKDIFVPLELTFIFKIEDGNVWFDILKEQFEEKMKRAKIIRDFKGTYQPFLPLTNNWSHTGVSLGLERKQGKKE